MYEMKDMKKNNKKIRRFVVLILVALLALFALISRLTGRGAATAQEEPPAIALTEEELWEIRNANWREDITFVRQNFTHPLLGGGGHTWILDIQHYHYWYVLAPFGGGEVFGIWETQPRPGQIGDQVHRQRLSGWPRSANLFDMQLFNEFLANLDTLHDQVPYLTDFEIVMGLWRAIAPTNDCHMSIAAPGIFVRTNNPNLLTGLYLLPFAPGIVFHFEEHYSETAYPFPWPHIRSITTDFEDLINTRVLAINGVDVEEIFNRMRPIFPHENEVWLRTNPGYAAAWSNRDFLNYINVINYPEAESVSVTLQDVNGNVFTAELPFILWHNELERTTHQNDHELMLFRARPTENYWFKHFPDENLMYLRLARNREMPGPVPAPGFPEEVNTRSTTYVIRQMLDKIEGRLEAEVFIDEYGFESQRLVERRGVDTFVLDLRYNPGGVTLDGFREFVHWAQTPANRRLLGSFYIVINHFTYSKGVEYAYTFREFIDDVVIIGSPTGGALNFFGGDGSVGITLPNSRITFSQPGSFFNLDPNQTSPTNTLYPDIFVHRTLQDYVNNHDAVMALIRQRAMERD